MIPIYQIIIEDVKQLDTKMVVDCDEFSRLKYLEDFLNVFKHHWINEENRTDFKVIQNAQTYILYIEDGGLPISRHFDKYLVIFNERCELNAYDISMADYIGKSHW